jgi:LysM repeat protein
MKLKRLLYYLIINILVSAATTLAVLKYWEHVHPPKSCEPGRSTTLSSGSGATPTLATAPNPNPITTVITITINISPTPPLPTSFPNSGVFTYTVKTGDTLGMIAGRFGVTVEEIMALNHLTDPNRVDIGDVLLIPIPPTLTPTPRPTPTITLTPTPLTPTLSPTPITPTPPPQVIIEGVYGLGDLATERVELSLTGGGEILLLGWQLKDQQDHIFTFPQFTLHPGGRVSVYTKAGSASVDKLYWNLTSSVWRSGETVTLVDGEGNVRVTYVVP